MGVHMHQELGLFPRHQGFQLQWDNGCSQMFTYLMLCNHLRNEVRLPNTFVLDSRGEEVRTPSPWPPRREIRLWFVG